MAIPFLHYFTRRKADQKPAAPAAPPPPLEKPSSDRLSKTVMPSSARNGAGQNGAPETGNTRTTSAAVATPAVSTAPASGATTPRTISFNGASNAPSRPSLPPAVALAMEPKIERVITLHLQDVIPQIPAGYTKPLEVLDGKTRVLLKAAEVEKGMANGRPTVSLASIHDQMPEIFLQSVGPGDTTQIALPFSRVL